MRIVTEIHETHSNMKESNDWRLLASALEARLQRANQLQSIDEMRRFVALHQLSVDTSGDGRVRGVKSGIKAQILAACRDAIRLLAFQRAFELRTMDEMRDFVAEHELPVNTGVRGRTRGVQASVKAQILSGRTSCYILAAVRGGPWHLDATAAVKADFTAAHVGPAAWCA